MTKVAILACNKANKTCAAGGCMDAVNNKTGRFSTYDGDIQLTAFMRCNGCSSVPREDEGIIKKIENIASRGAEVLHIGICTFNMDEGEECPKITEIAEMFEEAGLSVLRGTH
jgi:predicted metal-binding protein